MNFGGVILYDGMGNVQKHTIYDLSSLIMPQLPVWINV